MAKCEFLLAKNESLMIFPEGTRSRTGRIDPDSFSYGVGRLYLQIPDCRVMCIYLRGDRQSGFSRFPAPKQDFVMDVRSFSPRPSGKGLRAQRDCARQIVETLVHMENRLYREHG
jgi:1-acyl-sn-glycerol-3-phosphate acyltransferase